MTALHRLMRRRDITRLARSTARLKIHVGSHGGRGAVLRQEQKPRNPENYVARAP